LKNSSNSFKKSKLKPPFSIYYLPSIFQKPFSLSKPRYLYPKTRLELKKERNFPKCSNFMCPPRPKPHLSRVRQASPGLTSHWVCTAPKLMRDAPCAGQHRHGRRELRLTQGPCVPRQIGATWPRPQNFSNIPHSKAYTSPLPYLAKINQNPNFSLTNLILYYSHPS
jgi:hypothetical protein